MPKHKNVELEVHDYALVVAESLTKDDSPMLLRVDPIPDDEVPYVATAQRLVAIVEKWRVPNSAYFIVFEEPHGKSGAEEAHANPHYHVFFNMNTTPNSFRNILRKVWTKSHYCLKVADVDKVAQHYNYLCKGTGTGAQDGPKVVYRPDDLTDDIVAEIHALYWKNNDAIQAQIAKKPRRDKPAAHQILELCKNTLATTNKSSMSEDEIIDLTFDWYATHKWSMNTFQMKAVITWVSYNLNTDGNRIHLAKLACKFA